MLCEREMLYIGSAFLGMEGGGQCLWTETELRSINS